MSKYKNRSNLWVFVVYPGDSLPENYLEIIQSWHIPVLLSPVHDADLNADSTEKKKHIHIMLDFGSGQNKSYEQVCVYTEQLHGTIPVICHNRNAMIRYFIHKDNPEKHPYNIDDLVCISGFDYEKAFTSYSNDILIYKFIEDIIYKNMIYNYAHLCRYLSVCGYQYELNFLRHNTIHFKCLLDGNYQLIQNGKQIIVDESKEGVQVLINSIDK